MIKKSLRAYISCGNNTHVNQQSLECFNPKRFNGRNQAFWRVKKSLGDISQKVLTANLRAMEENGLLIRTVYTQVPPKVEYTLTDTGYSLKSVLDAMVQWGRKYQLQIQNH